MLCFKVIKSVNHLFFTASKRNNLERLLGHLESTNLSNCLKLLVRMKSSYFLFYFVLVFSFIPFS